MARPKRSKYLWVYHLFRFTIFGFWLAGAIFAGTLAYHISTTFALNFETNLKITTQVRDLVVGQRLHFGCTIFQCIWCFCYYVVWFKNLDSHWDKGTRRLYLIRCAFALIDLIWLVASCVSVALSAYALPGPGISCKNLASAPIFARLADDNLYICGTYGCITNTPEAECGRFQRQWAFQLAAVFVLAIFFICSVLELSIPLQQSQRPTNAIPLFTPVYVHRIAAPFRFTWRCIARMAGRIGHKARLHKCRDFCITVFSKLNPRRFRQMNIKSDAEAQVATKDRKSNDDSKHEKAGKAGKAAVIELNHRQPGTSTFEKMLAIDDLFFVMCEHSCASDIHRLTAVSKTIKSIVKYHEVHDKLALEKRVCTHWFRNPCWCCNMPICIRCNTKLKIIETPYEKRRRALVPACSKCYFQRMWKRIDGPRPNFAERFATNETCDLSCRNQAHVTRHVCGQCYDRGAVAGLEWRAGIERKQDKRQFWTQHKCRLCMKDIKWWSLRWWIDEDCGKAATNYRV